MPAASTGQQKGPNSSPQPCLTTHHITHASGFNELESSFCLLLLVKAFSLQKVVQMLEEVVVGCQEVRKTWWMRQNIIAQVVQLLKRWLCDAWSGVVMGKNWPLPVDLCWLQALRFSWHLIDLPSILLR